jgi:uncharacterized protein YkwD
MPQPRRRPFSDDLLEPARGPSRGPSRRRHGLAAAGVSLVLTSAALIGASQSAQAATATESSAAKSVFNLLNSERAANHLPALAASAALTTSAHRHNLSMAAANVLSHQLTTEAGLGQRVQAAAVPWHYVAENIGWSSNRTASGAVYLQQLMYGERAPNDGHRLNILSRSVRYVGIDVVIDTRTGRLWLTEDFADAGGPTSAALAASHNPLAALNYIRSGPGHTAVIQGWAVDPDNRSAPLRIAVYYDTHGIGYFPSGVARPDVARIIHAGPRQGFQITVRVPAGKRRMCVTALNIGPGVNHPVGCVLITT